MITSPLKNFNNIIDFRINGSPRDNFIRPDVIRWITENNMDISYRTELDGEQFICPLEGLQTDTWIRGNPRHDSLIFKSNDDMIYFKMVWG